MCFLQSETALCERLLHPSLPAWYTPNAPGQGTCRNVGSDIISQKRQQIPHNQSEYADSQIFGDRGLTLPLPQAVLWICSPVPLLILQMKPADHSTVSELLKQHFSVTLLPSTAEPAPWCIFFLYHVSQFFLPPLYIPFPWLHSSPFMGSFELPYTPSFQCDSALFFEVPTSMAQVIETHSSLWLGHCTWETTKWMTLVIGNMLCRPLS